ncbi:1916_t:CDS:1, partial [Acaulospora colombiana]
ETDYPYTLEALEKYYYRFSTTENVLGFLRNIVERRDNYSIAIRLLQHQNYDAKSTSKKLQVLKALIPTVEDYSRVLVLFQRNQFSAKRTFRVLDDMLSFINNMAGTSWKKLTDSSFFHHSLALLEKNGYDVERTTTNLIQLQKLGKDWEDFSCLLEALKENQFDVWKTIGDINWLNPIVESRVPLSSVLKTNNYSFQDMRNRFEEICEIEGIGDFFGAMN